MRYLWPIAFVLFLASTAFAQDRTEEILLGKQQTAIQVERAADGTPVAVVIDGQRWAIISIPEKRQALIDQAELAKQRQLNALKDEQLADKDRVISLHRAQFADCMKIVDLQRVSLDQANSIIRAGVPPKRSKILAFLENPITRQAVTFLWPIVANAIKH